jgi:predicted ester cyclase
MELHGRDGAREFYRMWNEAMPDNEVTIERRHACGSVVVEQGVFSGTHTGNLATPDGQVIPATGRSASVPYVEVFDMENDQVASTRLYFDQVELLVQLGLMPAPEGAAAS